MKGTTSFISSWVLILLLTNISFGIELIEEDIEVESVADWPEDLSTSSQVVFRPLFVYKQKKAVLDEKNRRNSEAAVEKTGTPMYNHYRPNYYYEPYLSYYLNRHHYRPYYYNYYSLNHYNPYGYSTGG